MKEDSLSACEGDILLVDANQRVESQIVVFIPLFIPVLNKIDLEIPIPIVCASN